MPYINDPVFRITLAKPNTPTHNVLRVYIQVNISNHNILIPLSFSISQTMFNISIHLKYSLNSFDTVNHISLLIYPEEK